MLSNLAETLHSSAKLKNKQVAKIWKKHWQYFGTFKKVYFSLDN